VSLWLVFYVMSSIMPAAPMPVPTKGYYAAF
jgi:hypothetical protein